ncbi:helix-hairpin-helix domain-containing protein [Marivirga tractuosa]|uniref:ComEA family DNA-binding protein n=1 Tax=Marivirga tractuosa TaxID=1006 RepID=UPI0035D0B8DD
MKQKIRIWLRNFFGFSRTETNGFIILIILMVIILSMPFLSKKIYSFYDTPLQSRQDKTLLNSLLSELKNNIEIKKEGIREKNFNSFDLNKSSIQQLMNSGFPEYLAKRIVKYREKVNPFESKKELLKIYGIDSAFYNEIQPYIKISKKEKKPFEGSKMLSVQNHKLEEKKSKPTEFEETKLESFDLNKVDSLQLQNVYGIGPFLF